MVRGTIIVTCPHCGKTFLAPDIEWAATVWSAPVDCPKCGATVDPNRNKGLWRVIQKVLRWWRKGI